MRELLRYGFILGVICAIASGSLAIVNSVTRPMIIARQKAEEEASLRKVMPSGERFEPVKSAEDEVIYYKIYDKNGEFIGTAFKASAKGYSSIIDTMAGMKKDATITAIKVLNQNETPGLGASISEPSFAARFMGRKAQDLGGVQAIAGATISSKAIIDSVKSRAQEILTLVDNNG